MDITRNCCTDPKPDQRNKTVLQCALCQAILRAPRTLNCFHSLCEDCLSSCVLEEDGRLVVVCPKCTYKSTTEKPAETISNPDTFSSSPVMLTLLDHEDLEGNKACTSCHNRSKTTPSAYWCFECLAYLCEQCFLFHSSLSYLAKHHTYSRKEVENTPILLSMAREICPRHGEKFTRFCDVEKEVCCNTCVADSHMGLCLGAHEIINCFEDVQSDFTHLKTSIKDQLSELDELLTEQNKAELKLEKFCLVKQGTIHSLTDKIGTNVHHRTQTLVEVSNQYSQKNLQEYEDNLRLLRDRHSLLTKCLQTTSKSQFGYAVRLLLQKKNIESMTMEVEKFVDEVKVATSPVPVVRFCSSLTNLHKKQSFGSIATSSTCSSKPVFGLNYKVEKARSTELLQQDEKLALSHSLEFGGNAFTLSRTIQTENKFSHVTGCDWLSETKIIIVDSREKSNSLAQIFDTSSGKRILEIQLKDKAYDVTTLPNQEVAITFPKARYVGFFNCQNGRHEEDLDMGMDCYGISRLDDGHIVVGGEEYILILDHDFNEIRTLHVRGESIRYIWTSNIDFIFYSDLTTNTVYSMSGNGDARYKYRPNKIQAPAGLIGDTNKGNLYVCEKGSKYLHIVNKKGKCVKRVDVGQSPTAIAMSKDLNKICIARGGRHNEHVVDIYHL